jgi:hypothetical protein
MKRIKQKKILYIPYKKEAQLIQSFPKPSIKYIPDWYKKILKYTKGDQKLKFPINSNNINVTIKRCVPFLDSLSEGYMFELEEDVYVEIVDNSPFVRWRSSDTVITTHTNEQFEGLPIPTEYYSLVFKWNNEWGIKTPKNYSIYFTHPNNRIDLPFHTLSGVVDCDSFNIPVNFPFLLKKNFEGIIPAGTPICQIIPIKNETWEHEIFEYNEDYIYIKNKQVQKTFSGSYKKNFWTRKTYK